MIKAVLLALPTYTMSCFQIPKTLCNKITSLLSAFWWRNKDSGKGIHWKSWNALCQPRSRGGRGFKDLIGFNKAMLGKQIWRLCRNPHSLLARVLKGKYFAKRSILEASCGTRPSFGWRSIMGAQKLMKRGMVKQIGLGEDLSLSSDHWLPLSPPRPPKFIISADAALLQLGDQREEGSDQWNLHAVEELVCESDVPSVLQIILPTVIHQSSYQWKYATSGSYSVKEGYKLWFSHQNQFNALDAGYGPNLDDIYKALWKIDTMPKIRDFLWRALSNCIATGSNMVKKKLSIIADCSLCENRMEDINHILFTCPFARLCWALSPEGYLFYPYPLCSIFENASQCLHVSGEVKRSKDRGDAGMWPWILWEIWKVRNNVCFNGEHL